MKAVLLALFLSLVQINAQSQFTATVYVRENNMVNGGYVRATLYYDAGTRKDYKLVFPTQGYSEYYDYNPQGGTGAAPAFRDQYRFDDGDACPCQTAPLDHPMPLFDFNAQIGSTKVWQKSGTRTIIPIDATPPVPGRVCDYYQPANSVSCCGGSNYKARTNLAFITVDAGGFLCSARFTNGREFFVVPSTIAIGTPPQSQFQAPTGCQCDKPLDILLVLDRSASIQRTQFEDMKIFVSNFVSQFTISSSAAALNLIHFNTIAWSSLTTINAGQTPANVFNALSDLQCCLNNPAQPSLCCEGWTSISAGIRLAAQQLNGSNRKATATQILIVLTDGFHNSRNTNPSTAGPFCYDNCVDLDEGSAQWASCIKAGNSPTPYQTCTSDLNNAMNYLNQQAPNVITYAVSVVAPQTSAEGKQISHDQALMIAKGDESRVITVSSFSELATKSIELVARACASNASPCGSACCGYCVCKQCKKPDGCDDGKYCTIESVPSGKICCETSVRPCTQGGTDKCKRDICYEEECIPDWTNEAKTCRQSSNACYHRDCVPADGSCKTTDNVALANIQNTDLCREAYCAPNNQIQYRPRTGICPPTNQQDPCFTYTCVPATGTCQVTAKTIPGSINTSDKCRTWFCDGSSAPGGTYPWTFNQTTCPTNDLCVNPSCVPSTGQCQYPPKVCRVNSDRCDFGYCNPATGQCVTNRTVCPAFENNNKCRPRSNVGVGNDGCDTATGLCRYQNKQCNRIDCKDVICNADNDGACEEIDTAGCEGGLCAGNSCGPINACLREFCDQAGGPQNCDIIRAVVDCPLEEENGNDKCRVLDRTVNAGECSEPPGPTCGCDATQGCVFIVEDCQDKVPTDGCHYFVADSTADGCCVERKIECNGEGDLCHTYECNPATSQCEAIPKCDLSGNNECQSTTCNPFTGECEQTVTVVEETCVVPPCFTLDPTSVCVPDGESCKYLPVDCTPTDKCKKSYCDAEKNSCVEEDIVCDDQNPCTVDACVEGECVFTDRSAECDDTNLCTIDMCDPESNSPDGCVFTPINVTEECEDYDLCTIDRCDPTVGCVHIPVNCSDGNPCTHDICDPFQGCLARSVECNTTLPCTIAFCNPDRLNCAGTEQDDPEICNPDNNGDAAQYERPQNENENALCDVRGLGCYVGTLKSPAVIGGVLGAAAIVGIVIGVVAFLALTGGGAWAAYSQMAPAGVANTMNNPIYSGAGTAGSNPLFVTA